MTEMEDCFRSGQLKKIEPDIEKTRISLRIAMENLEDATVHYDNKLYKWALIAAYTSMFHSSKALLFKDGVKERGHFCLCAYVKEKYNGIIESKYLHELGVLREQRHRAIYGDKNIIVKEVQETEAHSAIKIAEGFLNVVKKLIGNNKNKK